MTWASELEMVARLFLATLIGFLIGLERELAGRPAGERTYALVSLGAATFAIISAEAFPGGDTARIAAGVVTGLGFLGAGMILRGQDRKVIGLTTAAGIWAVGGVGLAIGAGMYTVGLASAALIGLLLVLERALQMGRRVRQRGRGYRDRG